MSLTLKSHAKSNKCRTIPTAGLSFGVVAFTAAVGSRTVSLTFVLDLSTLAGMGVLDVDSEKSGEESEGLLSMLGLVTGSGASGDSEKRGGVLRGLRKRGDILPTPLWAGWAGLNLAD